MSTIDVRYNEHRIKLGGGIKFRNDARFTLKVISWRAFQAGGMQTAFKLISSAVTHVGDLIAVPLTAPRFDSCG